MTDTWLDVLGSASAVFVYICSKVMISLYLLMKPGPDSIGIVAVSRNCNGVAARACGLVSLEPTKVLWIILWTSILYSFLSVFACMPIM